MTFAEIACVVVSVAAVLMGYLVGHFLGLLIIDYIMQRAEMERERQRRRNGR